MSRLDASRDDTILSTYYDNNDETLFGEPEGITVDHVNWLFKVCNIVQENPLVHLRQCSSSLFVLMVQRLLGFRIPDLHLEPNTMEKKIWNTKRVLEELSIVCGENLHESYISPEAVVEGDERHIALLVRVMYHIALHMIRDRQHEESGDSYRHEQLEPPPGHGTLPQHEGHPMHHEDPSSATNTSESYTKRLPNKKQRSKRRPERGAPLTPREEFVSEPPSNESLTFTKELVKGWDRSVVPPPKRSRGSLVDPLSVIELQHRIQGLEQSMNRSSGTARQSNRPCSHDSRAHEALTFSANRELDRQYSVQLQNEIRDANIERIRNARFVETIQRTLQKEVINQRSRAEQEALSRFRSAIKIQRRNYIDEVRCVRDEDSALRKATEALAESEKNRLRLQSQLMSEETVRLAAKHFAAVREARKVLNDKQSKHSAKFGEDILHLCDTVGSWRTQIFTSKR
jgi:hypothetical protein